MRSVSGPRNRAALAIAGLAGLAPAVWFVCVLLGLVRLVGTGTRTPGDPAADPAPPRDGILLMPGDILLRDLVRGREQWLVAAVAAICVAVALMGLLLLLAQVPRRARTAPLRLTDRDSALLASVAPDVLERALAQRADDIPGVTRCSVWVAGSSRSVWLQATAQISQEAEIAWAVADLRRSLSDDVAVALGRAPRQVDVLVRPNRSTVSRPLTGAGGNRRTPVGPARSGEDAAG